MIRQVNAELSLFMHIPFAEDLDDDTWVEKYRQLTYLKEAGLLPVKFKNQ